MSEATALPTEAQALSRPTNLNHFCGFSLPFGGSQQQAFTMADFDAIYHEQIEEGSAILEEANAALVPDPVIVRGAGNITV